MRLLFGCLAVLLLGLSIATPCQAVSVGTIRTAHGTGKNILQSRPNIGQAPTVVCRSGLVLLGIESDMPVTFGSVDRLHQGHPLQTQRRALEEQYSGALATEYEAKRGHEEAEGQHNYSLETLQLEQSVLASRNRDLAQAEGDAARERAAKAVAEQRAVVEAAQKALDEARAALNTATSKLRAAEGTVAPYYANKDRINAEAKTIGDASGCR